MRSVLNEAKEVLGIILPCILAAVLYGIVHDEITAHISLEYFTVAHPDIFGTHSPKLLGLIWGVIATWWVGLLLGILLSSAARLGSAPKVCPRRIWPMISKLMLISACAAFLIGIVCYFLASNGVLSVPAEFASAVPSQNRARFIAVTGAHNSSYAVGFVGGLAIAFRVALQRAKAAGELLGQSCAM